MRVFLLFLALASVPSLSMAEEWSVVIGFFDHPADEWDDAILEQAQKLEAELTACNQTAYWDFASKFIGYNEDGRGTVFVVYSPELMTESEAEAMLDATMPCVPDAYVKQMRYAGE